jgi:hypothetical protein
VGWRLLRSAMPSPRVAGRAFAAHPFGVQVATIRGCLKADAKALTSAALAASHAAALLYSAVVTATDPPDNTKSVRMKVMCLPCLQALVATGPKRSL